MPEQKALLRRVKHDRVSQVFLLLCLLRDVGTAVYDLGLASYSVRLAWCQEHGWIPLGTTTSVKNSAALACARYIQ